MKQNIIGLIFFISLGVAAQTSKPFTPTKGEIVFREVSKITDQKLLDESLKTSKEKLKKSLKMSLLKEEGDKEKEKEIEQMAEESANMMKQIFVEDSSQIHEYHFDKMPGNSENVILKISENRKDKKNINGYECFKVVYQYTENKENADEDYLIYAGDIQYQREMWVTDKIKASYHPVVFEKSILEKYYPLYILETQSDIKGFERKFILEKINLQ